MPCATCDWLGSDCPVMDSRNNKTVKCDSCSEMSHYVSDCDCCGKNACSECHDHNTHSSEGRYTALCDMCANTCDPEAGDYWHEK